MRLQRFAADRVLGSAVTIALYGPNGPQPFGECDSFKSTRKSSQKANQPLGQVGERTQDIYEGWEHDYSGAVIDSTYDDLVDQIDQAAQSGQKNLRFRVTETTTYYDGTVKVWVWPDTVLFGFDKDDKSAKDDVTWSFKGAAQTRVRG